MSKDDYEAIITVTGRRDGKRYYEDRPLNVPVHLATGQYEKLSDLQIREAMNDLLAEQLRREENIAAQKNIAIKCGGYDPFASQVLRRAA